jgi:hypothetical protein
MKYLEDENLTALTSELTDAALGDSRVINGRIEAYTMKRAGTDKKYAHALGERYVAEMELAENQLAALLPTRSQSAGGNLEAYYPPFKQQKIEKTFLPTRSQSAGGKLEAYFPPFKQQTIQENRPRTCSFDSINSMDSTLAQKKTSLGDFSEMGTRRLMTDLILTLNASFPDYDFGDVRPTHFSHVPMHEAVKSASERLSVLQGESFLSRLWSSIDEVIQLSDTEVYSFAPPPCLGLDFLTQTLVDDEHVENPLWSFNYFFVNKHKKRILFFCCVETMQVGENEMTDDDATFFTKSGEPESNFDLDPAADVAGGIPVNTV